VLNKMKNNTSMITSGPNPPRKTDGVSGSIHVCFNSNVPTLYAKYKGSWYKTTLEAMNAVDRKELLRVVKIHQWYATDGNADYIPFGASQVESDSTTDSLNDDTLFIPPYDGELESIVIVSATGMGAAAGNTRIQLRVNGTNGAFIQETIANELPKKYTFKKDNTFRAHDRVRIKITPGANPKNVTATSIWKYKVA